MSLGHSPSIVTSGLVLALDAANTKSYPGSGTTWTDLTGNGNTGTLTNSPTYNSSNQGSIVFNGSTQYVTISHNSIQNPSSITICSWVKYIQNGTSQNIVGKTDNSGYRFRVNNGGSVTWFDRGATNAITSSTPLIVSGEWSLVSVTGSSSGLQIYINETLSTSNSTAFGGNISTGGLAIGAASVTNSFNESFNGNISQVLIYNVVLTANQIKQNFNALRGRYSI
jgi:hypothetical protein